MRPVWWVVSALLVGAAVVIAFTRRHELVAALRLIEHVHLPRALLAVALEGASLACLAAVVQWLLRAGGTRLRLSTAGATVLGANAVAGALPGGAAFAVAWMFRQFRRRGVGQALAGSVLAVSGLMSGAALFVLLLAGVLVSGSTGPGAGLRPVLVGLAVFAVAAAAVAYGLSRFRWIRHHVRRLWRRTGLRSTRLWDLEQALGRLGSEVRATRPGVLPWLRPVGFALLNWLLDMACLVACMWSLDVAVPWYGLLAAYALTQVAGSLRLTPGGLGVVETSLAALLSLYGLGTDQAIAVTLLYRLMNYWMLQPVGWACFLGLAVGRGRQAPSE